MLQKPIVQTGGAEIEAHELKQKILNAPDVEIEGGTVYYFSQNGDDNNDGLSPEKALKSYMKMAELPLKSGDYVLFERGSLFRATDEVHLISGVTYAAYGKGEKPRIYGSWRDYADASIWTEKEKNLWTVYIGSKEAAGLINFNNDTLIGEWQLTLENVKTNGDFYYEKESGVLYLYCDMGNPGECFDNIEIATTKQPMRISEKQDIRVDNLCFKYCNFGAFLIDEVKNIIITNCEMGWHGGRLFEVRDGRPIRYGNTIEFWYRCENIKVENCWVYQVFDAAMTFQGCNDSNPIFKNIHFDNNLIEYCSMNIEYWARSVEGAPPPHISDITYKGNIIRFAGYGWGGMQRADKDGQAAFLAWNHKYEDLSNFVISENIVDVSDCFMIYMVPHAGLKFTNNTYYQKTASGTHPFTQPVKHGGKYASNQAELEEEIKKVEPTPKFIKWLED
ncbi:MAG: hypothetical protein E7542_04085 [Ruminococcaceae bacterium]|nr:hypothetical protein [Oscillospiraceae bacterium]